MMEWHQGRCELLVSLAGMHSFGTSARKTVLWQLDDPNVAGKWP